MAWCKETLELSDEELQKKLALSMDGVVLTVPPEDLVDRHNHCWAGETHVYRTKAEGKQRRYAGATSEHRLCMRRTRSFFMSAARHGCARVVEGWPSARHVA